ncbi:pentapeptide repeat-containing protein [Nostoc sp. C110]|uniref:pentapeptide repeat-containing protein n=1 Tax=Nostoc sp. C110 TaxID=3349876 RepID=UPI00370D2020
MPQDFSGQNLRGRSFKGQNLEGANFSYADIRGANFTGANLQGANFSKAKAGLQKRWAMVLVLVSWTLGVMSGLFSGFIGYLVSLIFSSGLVNQVPGWVSLIVVIATIAIIISQGLNGTFTFTVAVAGAIAGAIAGAVALAIAGAIAGVIAGAIAGVIAFAVVIAGAGAIAVAVAVAGALAGTGAIAIAIAGALAGTLGLAIAGAFFATISLSFISGFAEAEAEAEAGAIAIAGAIATIFILLSIYIAHQAMKGSEKYTLIRSAAIASAAFGGTSFRKANLTGANFSQAVLKSTDFRDANLTRTCFQKTKKLDRVRPGKTYLQYYQLQKVLVSGQGQDKNFDRLDLRGVNFQKAYLSDASFIAADLSNASFQDANLSRAKLVQAQLDTTDFTGANLTGAYIEDWNITSQTNFTGVRCQYIYMRLPTIDNPDPHRKPDNREEVFGDGEFGDFIKPIIDTLDLYHSQGVDPRAIAISFKQLAENHPEADLRIVGMEVRGEDKFLLRAKTAATANKSELSAEYFDTYNEIKVLPEGEIKLLLAEKDNQIRRLENMVMTALERPSFYSNTQIEKVNTMTNNPGGISQNVSGGNVYGGMQAAQGNNNVQTSTTYSSSEQKQNLAEAAAEIQALLEQLSQSYPTDTMSGKMALATEATQRIENNPTLMQKTISALKAGGTAALEQALSHPAASFVIAALDDWNKNNQ